ncbi:hypothetical protein KSP39_PZI013014 [Platanthera zijinensis]|uniref:Mitochondrial substrate carrier family protein n=1 Tax=Platanthera zijinensis TaxID=2320716 RepID=A0AAP0BDR4_9ASPA
MASQRRTSKKFKPSIKYWWVPLEVQSFKPDIIVQNDNLCVPSTPYTKGDSLPQRKSAKGFTVFRFRSAAAGLWDFVGQPTIFPSKKNFKHDDPSEKENIFFQFDSERDVPEVYAGANNFGKDAEFRSRYPSTAKSNFENLRRIKKMILFASCNRNINSFFQSIAFSSGKTNSADNGISIPSSLDMEHTIGSMIPKSPSSLSSIHTLETSTCTKEAMTSSKMELISSVLESDDIEKSGNSSKLVSKSTEGESVTNYQSICENDKLFGTLSLIEVFSQKPWLAIQTKLQHAISNNRHAIAGALAGTLVTLSLHPIDTVKTIIQANGTGQKSCYHIARRIISQHGILGLYRGIASNITSSAPISAIYTFTYESVKSTLLPLLPKEYHSLAHCLAGGCSSIATSVVFTPSECIKQQMQVSSQYQNCWEALIGCLQKGGIPSLYAGWGAVLCRNIPHSVIKFYTYESLQQAFSSAYPDSNLKTFQTLVCGGLAGSTAALFTTPFDVVKTRLQTQVPGSIGKYHGVFHALHEIARQEGFQGLYRCVYFSVAMCNVFSITLRISN